jgi:hypothetical protein
VAAMGLRKIGGNTNVSKQRDERPTKKPLIFFSFLKILHLPIIFKPSNSHSINQQQTPMTLNQLNLFWQTVNEVREHHGFMFPETELSNIFLKNEDATDTVEFQIGLRT